MNQKKLLIILISLIVLLGATLAIYFATREKEEKYVPKNVEVEENLVIDTNTGRQVEDLHRHEDNKINFALDEEKSSYSLGELVFGEPKEFIGVAKTAEGGAVLGVLNNKVLARSHPNYLYYYDLKEREAQWITTVGTEAYMSQKSDYTLYFEYTDITMGVNSEQKIMTFKNNTSARKQVGTLPAGYKPRTGAITNSNAYSVISKDYGTTRSVLVSDIISGGVNAAQQQKLDALQINFVKDINGMIYFSSDVSHKIYVMDESENLNEVSNFVGEKALDIVINGDNVLVFVENDQERSVYVNNELIDALSTYNDGYWVDDTNLLVTLYNGLFVYNSKEKKLDAVIRNPNSYFVVGNVVYYFDGTVDNFYSMEIKNR